MLGVNQSFCGLAGQGREAEGILNGQVVGFRACGLADVADFAVLAVEDHGDPLLAVEVVTQALPAQVIEEVLGWAKTVGGCARRGLWAGPR